MCRYFVIANSVASAYNLFVLSLGFLFSQYKGYAVVLHLTDMVMGGQFFAYWALRLSSVIWDF